MLEFQVQCNIHNNDVYRGHILLLENQEGWPIFHLHVRLRDGNTSFCWGYYSPKDKDWLHGLVQSNRHIMDEFIAKIQLSPTRMVIYADDQFIGEYDFSLNQIDFFSKFKIKAHQTDESKGSAFDTLNFSSKLLCVSVIDEPIVIPYVQSGIYFGVETEFNIFDQEMKVVNPLKILDLLNPTSIGGLYQDDQDFNIETATAPFRVNDVETALANRDYMINKMLETGYRFSILMNEYNITLNESLLRKIRSNSRKTVECRRRRLIFKHSEGVQVSESELDSIYVYPIVDAPPELYEGDGGMIDLTTHIFNRIYHSEFNCKGFYPDYYDITIRLRGDCRGVEIRIPGIAEDIFNEYTRNFIPFIASAIEEFANEPQNRQLDLTHAVFYTGSRRIAVSNSFAEPPVYGKYTRPASFLISGPKEVDEKKCSLYEYREQIHNAEFVDHMSRLKFMDTGNYVNLIS